VVAVLQERADPFQELVDQVWHLDRIENGASLSRAGRAASMRATHHTAALTQRCFVKRRARPRAAAPACYAAAEAECGPGICGSGDADDLSEDADGAQRGLLANVRVGRAKQLLDLGRKVTRQLGAMANRRLPSQLLEHRNVHNHRTQPSSPCTELRCAALRCNAQ
jgi:hypothetical protein